MINSESSDVIPPRYIMWKKKLVCEQFFVIHENFPQFQPMRISRTQLQYVWNFIDRMKMLDKVHLIWQCKTLVGNWYDIIFLLIVIN